MRSLCLVALLAVGAYCWDMDSRMRTAGDAGLHHDTAASRLPLDTAGHLGALGDIHSIHRRAEMETKMNTGGGPSMETNTQMDTGDQQMSAQAETHNRFRRWGGYYGGMGYGGMGYGGYGRGYGMGYGMRGYGGYGGMGGYYG